MNAAYSPDCTQYSALLQVVKQTITADASTTCHEHLPHRLRSSGRAKPDYSINTSDVMLQIETIHENRIFNSCAKWGSYLIALLRKWEGLAISVLQHLDLFDRTVVGQFTGLVASFLFCAVTYACENHQTIIFTNTRAHRACSLPLLARSHIRDRDGTAIVVLLLSPNYSPPPRRPATPNVPNDL